MIALVMGSKSDAHIVREAYRLLNELAVPVKVSVLSAHRHPAELEMFIKETESKVEAYVAFAGMAAHLAGAIAARTIRPVIGVPIQSGSFGLDALLSTAQMPKGVPVATVAINGGFNAGMLAAQIAAVGNPALAERLRSHRYETHIKSIIPNAEELVRLSGDILTVDG